jgi:hypothetical protein
MRHAARPLCANHASKAREEVAGEQARRLAAQKHRPAHRCAPRRGLEPRRGKQPPDGARRDAEAELQQLARDPLVAPARVLTRKPQNECPQRSLRRWPAGAALRVGPFPAHELAMPAQQRRRCHHKPVPGAGAGAVEQAQR